MRVLTLAALLGAAACAPAIQSRGMQQVVTERLYFGRNVAQTLGVTDSAWAVFVTDVVSARLPGGFTFWAAEGEWRGADGRNSRKNEQKHLHNPIADVGAGRETPARLRALFFHRRLMADGERGQGAGKSR